MRAEIAVFVLNLSDIIFLRTAPHISTPYRTWLSYMVTCEIYYLF